MKIRLWLAVSGHELVDRSAEFHGPACPQPGQPVGAGGNLLVGFDESQHIRPHGDALQPSSPSEFLVYRVGKVLDLEIRHEDDDSILGMLRASSASSRRHEQLPVRLVA